MRKFFAILFLGIIACVSIDYWSPRDKFADYGQTLREQINSDRFCAFEDRDCGFVVRYPSFFSKEVEGEDASFGHHRFAYHDAQIDSVLETSVIPNRSRLSPKEMMAKVAAERYAAYTELRRDSFVIAGTLHENGGFIDGYGYRAKYVLRNNAWYVLAFYYPKAYEHSFERLLNAVDVWEG
ncbi:MAG: hypothetical protein J1E58_00325 [Prevotella sp.]|nr:hypothetical protein [Prevotella sp.]